MVSQPHADSCWNSVYTVGRCWKLGPKHRWPMALQHIATQLPALSCPESSRTDQSSRGYSGFDCAGLGVKEVCQKVSINWDAYEIHDMFAGFDP